LKRIPTNPVKIKLVKNENEDMLEPAFIFEPFGGSLLDEDRNSDFDKKIQKNMHSLSLEQLMAIVRDSQNWLFSKPEKSFKEGKNKSNSYDETAVLRKIGSNYNDIVAMAQMDDPEAYLLQCLMEDNNKKGKRGLAAKNRAKGKPMMSRPSEEKKKESSPENSDEAEGEDDPMTAVRKKLKVDDINAPPVGQKKLRITTMVIRILEFAKILLFNQNWETRHGASLILRGASRKISDFIFFEYYDSPKRLKDERKQFILDLKTSVQQAQSETSNSLSKDLIIRCIVVLGLDRFSDFASDESNIIVRDTSSQTIANLIEFLRDDEITKLMILYFKGLLSQHINLGWEPKHGVIYVMMMIINL
jgi:hypothetical protein